MKRTFLALDYKQQRDVTRFLWLKEPNNINFENNIQVY